MRDVRSRAPSSAVLIIGNFLSASGHSRAVCEELSQRLVSTGWQVTTASDKPNRSLRLMDMVHTAWRSRHRYRIAQVDVFSGFGFLWAEVVCWVLRCADKPYVLTLHGGNLPGFAQRWPNRVRRLLRSAKAVTVPSVYLHEQLQPYTNELLVLPNALDIRHYAFRLRERSEPHLVWMRALHSIYNPVLAIKVVAELVREFPDIRLAMIGPDRGDGSREAVEQAISRFGVSEHVKCVGKVPKADVATWLSRADVFINTTNVDNTPVSVTEAMACGLCVVSTNVGGMPYLVKDQHDALLVPRDDAKAMAAAVRAILTDARLSKRLSQNARATAEALDWSAILPRWEDLLRSVELDKSP